VSAEPGDSTSRPSRLSELDNLAGSYGWSPTSSSLATARASACARLDAFMRAYRVVVVSDCVAACDDETDAASLLNISRYFGTVLASQEVAGRWSG
jgi:hypothetical protein